MTAATQLDAELAKFDDGVPFRATRHHAHHTWAKTFHSFPELYIRPQSVAEVEKAVLLARRCRRRISTVGCGHSPSDLTCTSSWMLNLDDFRQVLAVDQDKGIVTVQAGIRLFQLGEELDKLGLAMPNLGSINQQSLAGVIATCTHGSTLRHGIISDDIVSLRITLASGETKTCSHATNPDLFRAALVSLGALGVITEVTYRAVPAYTLAWQQTIDTDRYIFDHWSGSLWTATEYVRVWWFPYTRRAVVWTADVTDAPAVPPPTSYYDAWLGYHVYHNLLAAAQLVPRILPWVEWFVFGMQYGFKNGSTTGAVQPSRQALLMNCLYSQFVNEWAIPLDKGPEALRRLSSWLNQLDPSDPDYVPHRIPFSAAGLYVHAPVEVRVAHTALTDAPRPFLDSSMRGQPTLYLNATLYRPYLADPPCRARYYEAFEWLMRDLGGRPHWAKNFETRAADIQRMYGADWAAWRAVRDDVDPEGMFVGPWHRRALLGDEAGTRYALEEIAVAEEPMPRGGVCARGAQAGAQ